MMAACSGTTPAPHCRPTTSACAPRALQQASGCAFGADIHIDKQVPWGAGLGGGSSDAATVLLGLNRLWGLHWSRTRLIALAAQLGADVPFFIGGRPAWVEGIGERLSPLPEHAELPRRYAVVKPARALATAEIFASPLLSRATKPAIVADFLAAPLGFGRNDLQEPARALCSEVDEALELLLGMFGNSRMTGSGSAVFACIDSVDRTRLADWLGALPAGWTGRVCQALSAHPLTGWPDSSDEVGPA